MQQDKLDKFLKYLKHFLIGLGALPIAFIISTALVVMVIMLLPLLWGFITICWVNSLRMKFLEIESE
jgi:hypothetical protein